MSPLFARTWAALLRRPPETPAAAERRLGRAGERAAARLLRRSGYRILARNVRVPMGEADIVCVAPDRRTIVVVEVKTRRTIPGRIQPPPEANIHAHKRRKLLSVARHLAAANRWNDRPVRIDVVAVEWPARGKPILRHHIAAV
ncbi:MAG: YraN family protein [Phycisphaeraceae bacterium]|nr:YraN family protein [Phycisphaeraceae bacterium]